MSAPARRRRREEMLAMIAQAKHLAAAGKTRREAADALIVQPDRLSFLVKQSFGKTWTELGGRADKRGSVLGQKKPRAQKGLESPRNRRPEETRALIDQARRLAAEGMTWAATAAAIGVTPAHLSVILNRAGLSWSAIGGRVDATSRARGGRKSAGREDFA